MNTGQTDGPTAASEEPAATRSRSWLTVTIISLLLGLASAAIMTAAMFWIGNFYRGTPAERVEEGRRKLRELRAEDEKELKNYGWINRNDGVVRIPIDRAMQLLAAEADRQESPPAEKAEQPAGK